jgi:hypothetical protein
VPSAGEHSETHFDTWSAARSSIATIMKSSLRRLAKKLLTAANITSGAVVEKREITVLPPIPKSP